MLTNVTQVAFRYVIMKLHIEISKASWKPNLETSLHFEITLLTMTLSRALTYARNIGVFLS